MGKKRPPQPQHLYVERLISAFMIFFLIAFVAALFGFSLLTYRGSTQPKVSGSYRAPQRIERGTIYDRNGRLLAIQVKRQSLEAQPQILQEPRQLAQLLSPILKLDGEQLADTLANSKRTYLWVKRFLNDSQADKIRSLMEEQHLIGLRLLPEYRRFYPQHHLASHMIGFTNIDNIGLDGLEMTMNGWLLPKANKDPSPYANINYGNDIYLSIDIETQYIIDKIAKEALDTNRADNLIAILMDANNGDILAYLSLPEYDLGRFSSYSEEIRRNIPVANVYEPGSVFKIFPMAIFLDEGLVDLDEILPVGTIYNPESFVRYKISPIKDVSPHGAITPTEILIYSSNVGMATLSERISSKLLYQRITDFGFGRITGVPLPGESRGLLQAAAAWSLRTKPTIVFGQELAVTALQLVSAATVLTNGGVLLAPRVIKKVISNRGVELLSGGRQPIKEVISPATAANVLLMMEQVVASSFGTMTEAQVDGLRISGKSGTAQVFDSKTGRYDPTQVNGSILAIFPTENPKFILYISMLNPKGRIRYGGRIASPVARKIILALANRYNLPLTGNRIAKHSGNLSSVSLLPPKTLEIKDKIPKLIGLTKKELLPILQDERLKLQLEGNGRVWRQQPVAGTPIPAAGLKIQLLLR